MSIVELTQEELDFVLEHASERTRRKRDVGRVSRYNDARLDFMGIAGEFCAAKYLGCHFNPFFHRGGDKHQRDLWRGSYTVAVKTRHGHLRSDFLFPPHQRPEGAIFPDDFGCVGRWIKDYWCLELVGYFTKRDFEEGYSLLTVGGNRSGQLETRVGFPAERLRPIEDLRTILEQEPDAYDDDIRRGIYWKR